MREPSYFQRNHESLRLSLGLHEETSGLRKAQIAAIWALSSRVISKEHVSQAILPTGTGKTAVAVALPFAVAARRVLVVVPSQIVRRQVAKEFATLELLKSTGALPIGVESPKVRKLRSRMRSHEDWLDVSGYDVIVAIPNCISPRFSGVVAPPEDFFDLIIVDEAHHTPADAWSRILDEAPSVPAALLTATPFRRDKKRLPGEVAYWYPLSEAISDGVYSPIEFIPVKAVPAQDNDLTLATAVKQRLSKSRHIDFGSQVLVRTDKISEALRLREVYLSIGVDFPVLTSDLPDHEMDEIISRLIDGTHKGVIVVGVLTEGFNLPRLKIAAYHKRHQSFASTLQFVGRFARVGDRVLQPELLAFADELTAETNEKAPSRGRLLAGTTAGDSRCRYGARSRLKKLFERV